VKYRDLRDFIAQLERNGELKRIQAPISTHLEITDISDRVLRAGGPALLFENAQHNGAPARMPVLANLFGTPKRVAWGMGADDVSALRDVGELLASLREPEAPRGLRDAIATVGKLKSALWDMSPRMIKAAPCQEVVLEGNDVDLNAIPLQHCWPGDVAPLLTWGLVVTRGPNARRQNLGIYRQQLIGRNKLIMRWLSHRGGALDFRDHCLAHPGKPFPWPWRWGPTRPPFWAQSPPCPTAYPNTSLRACCAARAPNWPRHCTATCRYPPSPKSFLRGTSCHPATRAPYRLGRRPRESTAPHQGQAPSMRRRPRPTRATKWRSKAPTATIPAITTSRTGSRYSR